MKKNSTENSIAKETATLSILIASFIVCAITGLTTYFVNEVNTWIQWTYIIHVFSSIMLTLICLPYLFVHVKRAMGQRRAGVLFSGILKTVVLTLLCYSGFHILFYGQLEQSRWIFTTHVYTGFMIILLMFFHLAIHTFTLQEKQKKSRQSTFLTLNKKTFSLSVLSMMASIIGIAIAAFGYNNLKIEYTTQAVVENYEYVYGDHPFRPSQTETTNNQFIDQRQIGNSLSCEPCHQQITQQWRSSMHRQAGSDQTYVSNISLLEKNRGIAATRYCEGCHAPVALLSGQLSSGGTHGGKSDTLAFDEGVGCMGCHGIKEAVHVKGVASYLFEPSKDYLFANSNNTIAAAVNQFLIRINPNLHRKEMSREVLSKPELCATCHSQFMDKNMNNWGWVKMQDEYRAWLDSPYSGQNQQTFAHSERKRCQDCHMGLMPGQDPSANQTGLLVDHRSLGANTAIPLINGDPQQVNDTKTFLQTGKLRVTIDLPNRSDAIRDDKFVDEALLSNVESPAYGYLGESINIKSTVSNTGVGHNFPGGTLDINEAWMYFRVVDGQNQLVYESGHLNKDNSVDEQAIFFRSLPIDRQGKLVWKHDLFNMIGRSYKKSVPAGGSDVIEYDFEIPSWVKSPLTVTAVLRYRKFNQRYAQWALKDKFQELPIVDVAWDSIQLPVLKKPPVE